MKTDAITRAARGLLKCAIYHPDRVEMIREVTFPQRPALEQIRLAMLAAYDSTGCTDESAITDADPTIDAKELFAIDSEGDGTGADIYRDRLNKAQHNDEVKQTVAQIQEALKQGDTTALTAFLTRAGELAQGPDKEARLTRIIAERAYREDIEPPEDIPVLKVDGHLVLTAGNIGVIAGQSKAGKSAVVQSLIASAIGGRGDNLKMQVAAQGAIIHLDTEQSRYDHYRLIESSKRRAMLKRLPGNVIPLSLKGESPKAIRDILKELCRGIHKRGESIAIILIDGVADMVDDVNSIEESNGLVRELEQLATQYQTGIFGVLHLNPGSDFKTRGHLGSQLTRKAECNLMLEKKDGVTVIHSELNRRAAIPKEHGPRFEWSDAHGMHVSVATAAASKDNAKRAELAKLAQTAFDHSGANGEGLTHAKFWRAITEIEQCKERTAKARIGAILDLALVQKSEASGNYFLTC